MQMHFDVRACRRVKFESGVQTFISPDIMIKNVEHNQRMQRALSLQL